MSLSRTAEQYLQQLLNGGKGPLNRDVFQKNNKTPQKSANSSDNNKGGGNKKKNTPQQAAADLLSYTKQKAKQGVQNLKNYAKNEIDYYKQHPEQLAAEAGSLFINGPVGAAVNGGLGFKRLMDEGYSPAQAALGGTAQGIGGFILGKAGGKVADKLAKNILPKKMAPVMVTPTNAIKNTITEGPKLGEGTSHKIIADRIRAQHPDDWPSQIARRDLKTGKETIHELDRAKMKYNPNGKEMSTKEMFDYRENALKEKLANSDGYYDMTPGGKYVDVNGRLTDEAWLTPEADLHIPYLYDTESYLHVSPNQIQKGTPFDPELRAKNEAFWDRRGGDLGEGAYGTSMPDLRRPSFNDAESVLDYNINTYNRLHPLAYANEFKAPKRDYMIAGEQHLTEQHPNMRWLINQAIEHRGKPVDLSNYDELQHGLETIYDPMNINTLLDRRYGIPGDTGWGQTAIGNESLNTQIFNNRRFKVKERAQNMAESSYLDPSTGMIYNGVTKRPQLTYPDNKPLIMDKEEMDYLKSLGIKDLSEMHNEQGIGKINIDEVLK